MVSQCGRLNEVSQRTQENCSDDAMFWRRELIHGRGWINKAPNNEEGGQVAALYRTNSKYVSLEFLQKEQENYNNNHEDKLNVQHGQKIRRMIQRTLYDKGPNNSME